MSSAMAGRFPALGGAEVAAPGPPRPGRTGPDRARSDRSGPDESQQDGAEPGEPGRKQPGPGRPGLARRLAGRLRPVDQHASNGYALVINTVVTGGLGLLFWLIAARRYPAADVGRATAALAAMNTLAGITALSLTGAMAKFIPQSGRSTGRLIRLSYAGTASASAVTAAIFLLTFGRWSSTYSELHSWPAALAFGGSVLAWGIFTLQDGVLIGLRSAAWVAVENIGFGIAKIALLLAFATVLPHLGLYAAWMLPVLVSLPLVNLLIFGRLLPRHVRRHGTAQAPTARQVGRFLAGDFTGSACMLGTGSLAAVVVALIVSPAMNAYFYIAFTIGATLDLLAVNMAAALTVEGAHDPAGLAASCRSALRRTVRVVLPLAAVTAALAPFALPLFGAGYAQHSLPVLELMVAATVPRMLTELYLGSLRVQGRSSLIGRIQVVRAVLLIGLVAGLTMAIGIAGAGVAILTAQTVVAIAILPGLVRVLARGGAPGLTRGAAGQD
jgi:O-antigen/teichoic acid export membrane protein